MAWRDDKARVTLNREAAGSMQPVKTPRAFAELLFDHTNSEDLVNYDAASLAFLAEQTWEHAATHGRQCRYSRYQSDDAGRARDFRSRSSQRQYAFPGRFHYGGARRAGNRGHAGRPPDHRRGAR